MFQNGLVDQEKERGKGREEKALLTLLSMVAERRRWQNFPL